MAELPEEGTFGMPGLSVHGWMALVRFIVLFFLCSPLAVTDAAASSSVTGRAIDVVPPVSSFELNARQPAWMEWPGGISAGSMLQRGQVPARAARASLPLLGGRILIAGWVVNRRISASAELYNPSTDTWLSAGVVTSSRNNRSAIFPRTKRMIVWCGIVIPF